MNGSHISPMLIWLGSVFLVSFLLALMVWRGWSASRSVVADLADPEALRRKQQKIRNAAANGGYARTQSGSGQRYALLHVMAESSQPYQGYALLQSLLAANLLHGDRSIFHRHTLPNAQGRCLFSVASVQEPGTFDLSAMEAYTCPGLLMFFDVAASRDPVKDFKTMAIAAKQLVEDLGGKIYTAERVLLTEDSYRAALQRLGQSPVHA